MHTCAHKHKHTHTHTHTHCLALCFSFLYNLCSSPLLCSPSILPGLFTTTPSSSLCPHRLFLLHVLLLLFPLTLSFFLKFFFSACLSFSICLSSPLCLLWPSGTQSCSCQVPSQVRGAGIFKKPKQYKAVFLKLLHFKVSP